MPVLAGEDNYTWTAGNGVVFDLTDRTKWIIQPPDGFGLPDADIIIRRTPYGPGGQFLFARPRERQITLRIFFKSSTYTIQQQLRDLTVAAFSSFPGQGVLTIARAEGNTRALTCAYTSGLYFSGSTRHGVARGEELHFTAADPFWVDPAGATGSLVRGVSVGGTPLTYPQTLPFSLGGAIGTGTALTTVTNPGDWEAFPVITITGPCLNPTVINSTSGDANGWMGTVPTGYTLVFDHTQNNPQITLTDTLGNVSNAFYGLSAGASFWSLQPGLNQLAFLSDSGGGASLAYYPRYSGI